MLLLASLVGLVAAAPALQVQDGEPPVAVTQPTGVRGAKPLVSGYALTFKGFGSLANTPLGFGGVDAGGTLALTHNVDVFAGARMAVGVDAANTPQPNALPYVGGRLGGSPNGRTFFGLELQVTAAIALPRPSTVTWIVEPSALVSFTPYAWLELVAALHGMSAPQLDMWALGPGFAAAVRVAAHWSVLVEVKTLAMRAPAGPSFAPTLAVGVAFH